MPSFRARGKITLSKSRKNRPARRRTRKLRVTKSVPVAVKQYVNTAISRRAENKYKDVELGWKDFYQTIDNSSVQSLMPTITQGTTQSNRIGDTINIKRLKVSVKFYLKNLGANYYPSYVDIYIFKIKDKNIDGGVPTATDMSEFLENDSSAEAYNGSTYSSMRQLNKTLFKSVRHRRINLFGGVSSASVIGATGTTNPMKHMSFILTSSVKKKLVFNDSTTNLPTNDNLYIAVGCSQADGSAVFLSVGQYACLAEYQYEDM